MANSPRKRGRRKAANTAPEVRVDPGQDKFDAWYVGSDETEILIPSVFVEDVSAEEDLSPVIEKVTLPVNEVEQLNLAALIERFGQPQSKNTDATGHDSYIWVVAGQVIVHDKYYNKTTVV